MKKDKIKKLLLIVGLTVVFEILYRIALRYEEENFVLFPATICVVSAVCGVLFVAYIIMTHGFAREPHTPDMMNPTLPYEKRAEAAERINLRKKKAQRLLYVLIPLLVVLMLDFLYTFVIFPVSQNLGAL